MRKIRAIRYCVRVLGCFFLLSLTLSSAFAENRDVAHRAAADPEMVLIPGGRYVPLFAGKKDLKTVALRSFFIDKFAVSNEDYLDFVKANPRWRRSKVGRLFADVHYLSHWQGDEEFAPADANTPVRLVSWFAAKAFCKWRGKRLPSVYEWEYVALTSEKMIDGKNDPAFIDAVLEAYSKPLPPTFPAVTSGMKNIYGVYELHGIIWEWVSDFNSMMVTGESRGDSALERELYCGAGAVGVNEQAKINYPAFLRAGFRSSLEGDFAIHNLGFRCARDVKSNEGKDQ